MKEYWVVGKFKSGREFKVEIWSRSGNKIGLSDWSQANKNYRKSHKHHYREYGKDGYHKGFCKDDHQTDGRWYCEACGHYHNGPWGRDFAGVGPRNKAVGLRDRYLDISKETN